AAGGSPERFLGAHPLPGGRPLRRSPRDDRSSAIDPHGPRAQGAQGPAAADRAADRGGAAARRPNSLAASARRRDRRLGYRAWRRREDFGGLALAQSPHVSPGDRREVARVPRRRARRLSTAPRRPGAVVAEPEPQRDRGRHEEGLSPSDESLLRPL